MSSLIGLRFAVLATLLGAVAWACAPTDRAVTVPDDDRADLAALQRAHEAALAGDVPGEVRAIEEVLTHPAADVDARDNALALLDATYAEHHGVLPAGFALPQGLRRLEIVVVHATEPGLECYRTVLRGVLAPGTAVRSLTLRRWPDDVVLAHGAREYGRFSTSAEDDGGTFFELEGDELGAPLPSGVVRVVVELGNGATLDVAVVVDRLVSSATPRLRAPAADEVLAAGHPAVELDDFRSPEFAPFETRSLSLWLVHPGAVGLAPVWSLWTSELGASRYALGAGPDTPPVDVSPGRYWLGVTFGERRRFGPIGLVRASRTSVPFTVR